MNEEQNEQIILTRAAVKEIYRHLPLCEITRDHLKVVLSDVEDYILKDGDEEWEQLFLPAPKHTTEWSYEL
jgi:hypothetical protein|tara:strand:+ start:23547 stop:23759 length:213 start_codon:yes stop_codon:yes gene_type:complete